MLILNNYIKHEVYTPSSALEDFIETYFIVSIKEEVSISELSYSVPPRAKTVLLIKKNESTGESQVLVIGPHLVNLKRAMHIYEKWCVAVLKPGASMSFFNLTGSMLKDHAFDLKELHPKFSAKIEAAFTTHFDIEVLDEIMHSCNPRLVVNPLIPKAVELLENSELSPKISEVADDLGITIRQLQREFLKWVGVSPKQYQGIARLRNSLNLASGDTDQNWTQIAAQSGYFDQPHLNKNLGNTLSLRPSEIKRVKPK